MKLILYNNLFIIQWVILREGKSDPVRTRMKNKDTHIQVRFLKHQIFFA